MIETLPIIDVWMQHPNARFVREPWLASLMRWMGVEEIPHLPLEFTLGLLEQAGVTKGLCAAWCGPRGWLIPNEEVAKNVRQSGGRLAGIASADLQYPMDAV